MPLSVSVRKVLEYGTINEPPGGGLLLERVAIDAIGTHRVKYFPEELRKNKGPLQDPFILSLMCFY